MGVEREQIRASSGESAREYVVLVGPSSRPRTYATVPTLESALKLVSAAATLGFVNPRAVRKGSGAKR